MLLGDYIVLTRVVLAVVAGAAYAFNSDWPRASFFWLAAALETSTIFFK